MMIMIIIDTGKHFSCMLTFIYEIIICTNSSRCYVIYHLPHLKFLDSSLVTKNEKEEAALRGKFFKIIKPGLKKYVS